MPMHRIRGVKADGRRRTAVTAALVAGSTVLTGSNLTWAGGAPTPAASVAPLDWSRCVPGSEFDCATVRGPLDYSKRRQGPRPAHVCAAGAYASAASPKVHATPALAVRVEGGTRSQ